MAYAHSPDDAKGANPEGQFRKRSNEMSNSITRSLLLLTAVAVFILVVPAYGAGPANDPVSGLPLAPGMTPSNEPLSITICGKPAQANQTLRQRHRGRRHCLVQSSPAGIPHGARILGRPIAGHVLQSRRHEGRQHHRNSQKRQSVFSHVSHPEDRTHGASVDSVQPVESDLQVRERATSSARRRT